MASLPYDIPSMFAITQDLDIELLDEGKFWKVTNEEGLTALQEQRRAQSWDYREERLCPSHPQERTGLIKATTIPIKGTAFSDSMIMYVVNTYMWNLMQCSQSFGAFAVEESTTVALETAMVIQTEAKLARYYATLTVDRPERERTSTDSKGPLLFNCLALLWSAQIRVFTGADDFNNMTLLTGSDCQVPTSVEAFISTNAIAWGPFMTRVVDKAYGAILTPLKAGYLLVRKIAAVTWSLEHPIAGWDCTLLAAEWLHTLEMSQLEDPPDHDKMMIISNFRNLLGEADSDGNEYGYFAGDVSAVWVSLIGDTRTWGITSQMPRVIRKLFSALKQDWQRRFPNGNFGGLISQS
jgi:hypothetical protein